MSFAKIRPRRGTATQWETANPILAEGEIGIEVPNEGVGTGEVKIKFGDGVKTWADLPYAVKPLEVVDNLLSESTELPLSANQGKVLNEKIEPIGTIFTKKLSSSKAVTANNWSDILSLELPAGTYLITGSIYTSNTQSEGTHHLLLSNSSSSTTFDNSRYQPNGRVATQVHKIVTITTKTTFYLKYLHTVATDVTVANNANTNITAVRIK